MASAKSKFGVCTILFLTLVTTTRMVNMFKSDDRKVNIRPQRPNKNNVAEFEGVDYDQLDVTSFQNPENEKHVCTLYIYTDPFLWRQVYKMEGK